MDAQTIIPPSTLWEQFTVIGVMVLVLTLMARAGWSALKQWRQWQREEDDARSAEREKQRVWQEAMFTKQAQDWQAFISRMQNECAADHERDRKEISEYRQAMERITSGVNELSRNVSLVMTTLQNHIIADDARFDVLLDAQQKAKIRQQLDGRLDK